MKKKLAYYIDPTDTSISLPNSDVSVDFEGKDNFRGKFSKKLLSVFVLSNKLVGGSHQVNLVSPVPVYMKHHVQTCVRFRLVSRVVARKLYTSKRKMTVHSRRFRFVAGITNNNRLSLQISN